MNRYDRRLPHWDAVNARLFVTFCLDGSLPVGRAFRPSTITHGKAFVVMDRMLDRPKSGPVFLKQPEIAEMVLGAILDGDRRFGRYDLHSFVIMANHIHLLVTSTVPQHAGSGH